MASSHSESEEEAIGFDELDYDRLTDECLSRTEFRKRGSSKKKLRIRETAVPRRSHRIMHNSGSSGSRKDSSGKHGRSDLTKKHRNAQRVFKVSHREVTPISHFVMRQELGTVLQVIDFGVPPTEMEGAASDWIDPFCSMDDTATERTEPFNDSIDETPTDAFAELELEDADADVDADALAEYEADDRQWDQGVKMTLEEVLRQNRELQNMGTLEVPSHIADLVRMGEEAHTKVDTMRKATPKERWSKSLTVAVENALSVMGKIVSEMRENCHEYRSNSSWSSASSGGSLCDQKDHALLIMLRILQDLYDEVAVSTLTLTQLIYHWFCQEKDDHRIADPGFRLALKLAAILREIVEFEYVMCHEGVGPVKVLPQDSVNDKKEKQLIVTFDAVNRRVCCIQETILEGNSPDGEEMSMAERGQRADMLQKCWESVKEVTHRVASCHPTLKCSLYTYLLTTLTSAVHSLKNIQSTKENLEILEQMRTVLVDQDDPPSHLTDKDVEDQAWILPCLKALRSFSDNVAKQICKSRSFKTVEDADPLQPLRFAFMELIQISTVRMIRLTQPCQPFDLEQIKRRRDEGLKMMFLLSRYDRCRLCVNSSEETSQYEMFEKLTNLLLNNVLHYQTKLQSNDIAGNYVIGHQVSISSSGEFACLQEREPSGCLYGSFLFSEATSRSSCIGVGSAEEQERSSFGVVSGDTSLTMPNPFRDAQLRSGAPLASGGCWTSEESNELQRGHSNPLSLDSGSNRDGLPHHPLSDLSEQYTSEIPPHNSTCPGAEHFYNVSKNELTVVQKLGSGSTGQVFKMSYRGVPVAVKIMNGPRQPDSQKRLVHECEMHRLLACHPNIVQFYGQCLGVNGENEKVGLIMELCSIGSLFKIIREARHLQSLELREMDIERYAKASGYIFLKDWILRIKLACDITAGMEYLQSRDIVHRDLTSYNVVLSCIGQGNCWVAKICDFERSRHVPRGTTIPRSDTTANSCAWASPEVLKNGDYSTQADVFSAGVVLWEILTLDVPWEGMAPYRVIVDVPKGERLAIPPPNEASIPEYSELVSLIKDAWKEDPNERPTMKELHDRIYRIGNKIVERSRRENKDK